MADQVAGPTIVFLRNKSDYAFLSEIKTDLAGIDMLARLGHHVVGLEFPEAVSDCKATCYRAWIATPGYREIPNDAIFPDSITPGKPSRGYLTDALFCPV